MAARRAASPAREVVAPFVLTRIVVVAVALLAAATIPFKVACEPCDLSSALPLNALSRWDGGAYLSVARDGYSYEPGAQSNVTFSPLLPLLMRALAALAGRTDDDALLAAGVIVANVSLFAGVAALVALGRREVGEASARRGALYLLVFPTTVFLSAVYPESLFLALAAGSLLEARRGRWWRAGALAALGALARPFGVILAVPLAVERVLEARRGATRWRDALAILLPVGAFAGWQAYLYRLTGDPLVFLAAQRAYRREASAPWVAIAELFDPTVYGSPWLVAVTLVAIVALVVLSWRVLHPATATLGTVVLAATLSSGTLLSFPRYALAVFPAFLVLGTLGRYRVVHVAYLVVATAFAMLLTAMFAAWWWVA